MNDPSLPLHKAIRLAVIAAMTGGYTSPSSRVIIDPEEGTSPVPYVVMGNDTVIEFPTKTTEGGDVTHTITCWARTYTEAMTLANVVVAALTSRTSPLDVTGFTTARAMLDFRGPAIRDDAAGEDEGALYGVPVRVRYWLVQN